MVHCNSNYDYKESISESKFLLSKKKIILEILLDNYLFYEKIINLPKSNKIEKFNFIDKKYFLISRRLVKRTGVYEFVKLINKESFFDNYLFIITGDGPLKNDILKLTKNNILFFGEIDELSLDYLKNKAFCYIIPSIEAEGYSLLAKEAIILNKFVIHTNQGGLKESLNSYQKAKIFEFNNIDSLKKIFNSLTYDLDLDVDLSHNFSNKYNKKEFINKIDKLFNTL